jgi:hypothetical protein
MDIPNLSKTDRDASRDGAIIKKNLQKTGKRNAKNKTKFLGIIHRKDGTVEFKTLEQDDDFPELLRERVKGRPEVKSEQLYLYPQREFVSFAPDGTRVVQYVESFIFPISPSVILNFSEVAKTLESESIDERPSNITGLFKVVQKEMTAIEDGPLSEEMSSEIDKRICNRLNCGLSAEDGHTVTFTIGDAQKLREAYQKIMEFKPVAFEDSDRYLKSVQENCSLAIQNLLARCAYLAEEKAGHGVLGGFLSSKGGLTLMFIGLMIVIVLIQMFSNA